MPDQPGVLNETPNHGGDAFFVLRDCRELFQRRLVEIIRLSGIAAPSVIDAFSNEIGLAHDELASSSKQDGFEQTHGLTASRISLVGHDDLDLEIRIGDIINRLKGNERIDRWRVQLRYMTLLNRPGMSAESNPAGLEPISRGLWTICRESNATLDRKLDLLDLLEAQLEACLPNVYLELNTLLEGRRVEPAQVRPVQRGVSSNQVASQSGGAKQEGLLNNALSTLQQTLRQQFTDDPARENFAQISGAEAIGNAALSASTLTMLNHLMERLNAIEKKQIAAPPDTSSSEWSDTQAPLRALRSKDLDLPLGKPAAIALDTLSLIFEAIFATTDLPDVVKAIISRLQIPLLKIAIFDDTFFADPQHPARQLINRIANAAFGLAQDVGRDHAVCQRLAELADAVRVSLNDNDRNLQPHLDNLEKLIVDREQSLQINSVPYTQLVQEHERRLISSASAHNWLFEILTRCTELSIRTFLSKHWLQVMEDAAADGGTHGTRWNESKAIVDELLWSIQPKQNPEERKRLVALVPQLIRRLNEGLDHLNVSAEERAPFLDACFDLQTAALRNRIDVTAPNPKSPASSDIFGESRQAAAEQAASPSVEILERQGKIVQYVGKPEPVQPSWRTTDSTAKQGDWITFTLPDEEMLCGRHCGKSADSGSVLLFNSDWGYAVAINPSLLMQQLANGQARILSTNALFDEAAERALGKVVSR